MSEDQINSSSKKRSLSYMKAQEMEWKLKSKQDFYVYLDKHLQYFLPPQGHVNKDFLKQVFGGEKMLLKKKAVTTVEVPYYDELSVKRLWPQYKKDPEFAKYFPDVYVEGKGPSREYFYGILNTLYPEYLGKVMGHANEMRRTSNAPDTQK